MNDYQHGDYMSKYGDQSDVINKGGHPRAPMNPYPEQSNTLFEYKYGPEITYNRGPQRFQEGVETDTDVPYDFQRGAYVDTQSGARPNIPQDGDIVLHKWPAETMKQRAHMGSASWIEAPEVLGDFVTGTQSGEGPRRWEYAFNSGLHQNRPNAVRIDG